jgi:hypothetical protein
VMGENTDEKFASSNSWVRRIHQNCVVLVSLDSATCVKTVNYQQINATRRLEGR